MTAFAFSTRHAAGAARLGTFTTPHGPVETPAFMPVGTHGTIKGLSVDEVAAAGGRMILSNAFHLYLRPGDEMVRALGGLHAFTRWEGPMLTDSGGFQVFSLAQLRTVTEQGITFRSPLDGSLLGSIASIELPPSVAQRFDRVDQLQAALLAEHGIEIPVIEWGGRRFVRISAMVYNRPAQYETLAAAIESMAG